MAYVRSSIRGGNPPSNSRIVLKGLGRLARWLAMPAVGLGLATWCVATFASLYSATSTGPQQSFVAQTLRLPAKIGPGDPRSYADRASAAGLALAAAPFVARQKSERMALAKQAAQESASPAAKPASQDPFAQIVAEVSRGQVLAALAKAGLAISQPAIEAAAAHEIVLAYRAGEPVDVILELPRPQAERFGPPSLAFGLETLAPEAPLAIAMAARMKVAYAMTPAAQPEAAWGSLSRLLIEEPAVEQPVQVAVVALPEKAVKPAQRPKPADAEALAFARPDKPVDPKPFNKLFKRQDGVAIYDISAGLVYMPDGSKLEAHSGIGKMADNPKYVHVRNNGPTPPNTYKLTMRETRFYGVEAIRMTPITSKPMHGRDGFLTHSYLLRSRRPESHGCVAFKNYPQFLKAFKQGKVKQLVVVPSIKDVQVPKGRNERGA